MAEHSKSSEENELVLELSIGGIFGNSNRNLSESMEKDNRIGGMKKLESKREIHALRRRELKRKREEKLKKSLDIGSSVEDERNMKNSIFRQMTCGNIRPYNLNVKPIEDAGVSNGSAGYASSTYSDGQCSSDRGGVTEHSRSDSSNSPLNQQLATTSTASHRSDEPTGSSKPAISTDKLTDSSVTEPGQVKPNDQPNPHESSRLLNQRQNSFLARMPCVSTTGNGPNGKTVSGFLYRYTKNEVSIVCVCHGRLFSPGGFVEHAGGVDIVHPLKHITIFPTAFAS